MTTGDAAKMDVLINNVHFRIDYDPSQWLRMATPEGEKVVGVQHELRWYFIDNEKVTEARV